MGNGRPPATRVEVPTTDILRDLTRTFEPPEGLLGLIRKQNDYTSTGVEDRAGNCIEVPNGVSSAFSGQFNLWYY